MIGEEVLMSSEDVEEGIEQEVLDIIEIMNVAERKKEDFIREAIQEKIEEQNIEKGLSDEEKLRKTVEYLTNLSTKAITMLSELPEFLSEDEYEEDED